MMIGWLGNAYLWMKAAHIIFVIFWMAGLFMLPRFLVYHQESVPGSEEEKRWVERERRLLRIILNPSMIIVWVFGLLLALDIGAFQQGWFHVKFLIVILLSAYHGWMSGYAKKLARGERRLDGKTLRLLNEVPGAAAAIIVIMAIVKPF
jgi:protoporphyrinogen IX oxidase